MSDIAVGVYSPSMLNLEILWDSGEMVSNRHLAFDAVSAYIQDAAKRLMAGEQQMFVYQDYRQWVDDMAEIGYHGVPDWEVLLDEVKLDDWFTGLEHYLLNEIDWEVYVEGGSWEDLSEVAVEMGPYVTGIDLANMVLDRNPRIEMLLLLDTPRGILHVVRSSKIAECAPLESPYLLHHAVAENSARAELVGWVDTYVLPEEMERAICEEEEDYMRLNNC
jgi:hypothetical protein